MDLGPLSTATTILSFAGGVCCALIWCGYWIGRQIAKLEQKFTEEIHQMRLDFSKELGETRHTLYGRLDMQHTIQEESKKDLEMRIRSAEITIARLK